MKKPAIVLVHGFWGNASHWNNVILSLSRNGYHDLHAVDNPLTSLAEDAERTRKMVTAIEGPVILVGHSYGGAVISEMGNLPNVIALVFIAAFAPDNGESPGGITQQHLPAAAVNLVPDNDGYLWLKRDKFKESFCQDVSDDEALVMSVTQKAPLAETFGHVVHSPAWKTKPSWYQISTEDRMIHPENQSLMAQRLGARGVISLDASHASLVSRAEAIAALIDEAARTLSCGD